MVYPIRLGPASNPAAITPGGSGLLIPSFELDLDDAGSGAVNLALKRGIGSATFTRATTATTVNSAGTIVSVASGVARSYYDPTTLAYMGYLAEGARTNLFLQSEAFGTSWTAVQVTIGANSTTAPDGAATADTIIEDVESATHAVAQVTTITAGDTITVSVFVKNFSSNRFLRIQSSSDGGTNGFRVLFNPATGAIALAGAAFGTGTFVSASSVAYPNGWYRLQATGTVAAAATAVSTAFYMQNQASSYTATYTGDGTSGVYLWGAQFERAASFASSYIPTTTGTVTRNADVLTYTFAGNASATQGTCYAELSTFYDSAAASARAIAFDGTAYNIGSLGVVTGIRTTDGTNNVTKTGLTSMATAVRKRAMSYGSSGLFITGDGASAGSTSFDGDIGSTSIAIGCTPTGAAQLFGTIKNVRIWQRQLASAQLQAMTA